MNKVHVFKYSIRLSIGKMLSLRAVGVYVVLLFYSSLLEAPVKEFLIDMGAKISPWLFPHFLSNVSYQLVIAFASIYFFSDTPYLTQKEMYQINRCGRHNWIIAHILSLIETAFAFAIVCCLISNIVLFPYVEWNMEWGSAIKTLALTNASEVYGSPVMFSYRLVGQTAPIPMIFVSISIVALFAAFLGSVMLTAGLAFNRICAAAFATAIPMWSVIVYNMSRYKMSHLAPLLWMGVADIGNKTHGLYILPPYWYIFLILILGVIMLSVVSIFLIKVKDCILENED